MQVSQADETAASPVTPSRYITPACAHTPDYPFGRRDSHARRHNAWTKQIAISSCIENTGNHEHLSSSFAPPPDRAINCRRDRFSLQLFVMCAAQSMHFRHA
jgi:hypothetical protein